MGLVSGLRMIRAPVRAQLRWTPASVRSPSVEWSAVVRTSVLLGSAKLDRGWQARMPLGLDVGTLKLMLAAGAFIAAAIFLVAFMLDRRLAAGEPSPPRRAQAAPRPEPDLISPEPGRPVAGSPDEPAWPLPNPGPRPAGVALVSGDARSPRASRRLSGGPPPLVTRVPSALSPAMQDRARSAATIPDGLDAYTAARKWTPPRRRPLHSNPRFLAFLAGTTVVATLVLFLGVNLVLFVTSPAPAGSSGPANALAGPSLGAPASGLETPTITAAPAVERTTPGVESPGVSSGPSGAPGATPPLTGGQPPASSGSPIVSASASATLAPSASTSAP